MDNLAPTTRVCESLARAECRNSIYGPFSGRGSRDSARTLVEAPALGRTSAMAMRALMIRVYRGLLTYALKFGVIGAFGYIIDVGIFNLLRLEHLGQGTWASTPVGDKVVSVTVATIVTWFCSRYWTFKDRRQANFVLELLEFSAIAGLGMGIAVGC